MSPGAPAATEGGEQLKKMPKDTKEKDKPKVGGKDEKDDQPMEVTPETPKKNDNEPKF